MRKSLNIVSYKQWNLITNRVLRVRVNRPTSRKEPMTESVGPIWSTSSTNLGSSLLLRSSLDNNQRWTLIATKTACSTIVWQCPCLLIQQVFKTTIHRKASHRSTCLRCSNPTLFTGANSNLWQIHYSSPTKDKIHLLQYYLKQSWMTILSIPNLRSNLPSNLKFFNHIQTPTSFCYHSKNNSSKWCLNKSVTRNKST